MCEIPVVNVNSLRQEGGGGCLGKFSRTATSIFFSSHLSLHAFTNDCFFPLNQRKSARTFQVQGILSSSIPKPQRTLWNWGSGLSGMVALWNVHLSSSLVLQNYLCMLEEYLRERLSIVTNLLQIIDLTLNHDHINCQNVELAVSFKISESLCTRGLIYLQNQ